MKYFRSKLEVEEDVNLEKKRLLEVGAPVELSFMKDKLPESNESAKLMSPFFDSTNSSSFWVSICTG